MSRQKNTKKLKTLAFSAVCLFAIYTFAVSPRKVTIPAHSTDSSGSNSEGVKLMNGSSVPVNYSITCYDKNGTQKFQKTGLTLAPKAQVTHAGNAKCSDGVPANSADFQNNMIRCGYTNYANRASKCPTGYSLCTRAQVTANAGTSSYNGWVSDLTTTTHPPVAATWSYSSDNGTNWNDSYTDYYAVGSTTSTNKCASSTAGGGTVISNCDYTNYDGSYPFCCPSGGGTVELPSQSCDVEIQSSTSTEGYLQSPSFKGNAPF